MKNKHKKFSLLFSVAAFVAAAVFLMVFAEKKEAKKDNLLPTRGAAALTAGDGIKRKPAGTSEEQENPDRKPTPDGKKTYSGQITAMAAETPAPETTGAFFLTQTPAPEATGAAFPTQTPESSGTAGNLGHPTPNPEETVLIPAPTFAPTQMPEITPTRLPEVSPTKMPEITPTKIPKISPTKHPTANITLKPTQKATDKPSPTAAATVPPREATLEYFARTFAKACGISGEDDTESVKEKGIITFQPEGETLKRIEAFILLRNAARYLDRLGDGTMDTVVKGFGRLSDIGALNEYEKDCAYFVYANGLAEGKSDGAFTRTRSILPEEKITEEEVELYIGRLCGSREKFVLSPDGQLTRKSEKRNMNLYPYLLDSIPDDFYTRIFSFMSATDMSTGKSLYESGKVNADGTIWKDGKGVYASPVMLRRLYGPDGGLTERYHVFDNVAKEKELECSVEEYLFRAFNVDYRKTPSDAEWKNYMREMLRGQSMGSGVDEFDDALVENYLKIMEKNHTVIECDRVRAEASTIFEDSTGTYIRCYVHYCVISYDSDKTVWTSVKGLKGNINPLLFNLTTENYNMVVLSNLKKGEWRDGYFDIRLGQNAKQGIAPMKVYSVEFLDLYNQYSITDY